MRLLRLLTADGECIPPSLSVPLSLFDNSANGLGLMGLSLQMDWCRTAFRRVCSVAQRSICLTRRTMGPWLGIGW